ncbi:hypothetical protein ABPG72_018064 [Tetrahymena utriculariae]
MQKAVEAQNRLIEQDRIILISHDTAEVIQELRSLQLLNSPEFFECTNMECLNFEGNMNFISDQSKADGGRFRCHVCLQTKTLRKFSIFEGSKLPLVTLYRLIFHCFANGMSQAQAELQTGISHVTVRQIYKFCKKSISVDIQREYRENKLCELENGNYTAQNPPTCEADETLISHLNQIENKSQSQVWLLGARQRGTDQVVVEVIGNASMKTIVRINQFFTLYVATNRNIRTLVYTDSAQCYNGLRNIGFTHVSINKKREGFTDGPRTTNRIESLWSELKSIGRFDSGLNFNNLDDVQIAVDEVVFRWKSKRDDLYQLLSEILETNYYLHNLSINNQ